MTNRRLGIFAILAAGAIAAAAQTSGTCAAPLAFPAKPGNSIAIESRSGEVDIVGKDQEGVRVTCTLDDLDRAKDVHIEFEQTGDFGKLLVRGGWVHNLKVRIELPRRVDLKLRVPAGEVRVEEINGDKDIALGAGEINVSNVTGKEYRSVKATVDVGAVNAQAFGVGKGGFFRSFERDTPGGLYKLRAHLTSGNIQLN